MEPLVLKRVFPCSKRRLFDAWSKPALMTQWFFGSQQPRKPSTVTNSFAVGGTYELTMHMQSGDFSMRGEYRAINRYYQITFTWSAHNIQDSLVDLHFKELSPNRTELTLTQSGFPDEAIRTAHINGWGLCLDNLERFVAQPDPAEPGQST
jgi:uncharacterized protein YndB with AHSA1/START domain